MSFIESKPASSSWKAVGQLLQMGLGFDSATHTTQSPATVARRPVPEQSMQVVVQPDASVCRQSPKRKTTQKVGRPRKKETLLLDLEGHQTEAAHDDYVDADNCYVIGLTSLKHPKIFPPPNTCDLDVPRRIVISQATIDKKGVELELLGNSVTSCYTTQTLNVIAVLNEMWQEQGAQEDGRIVGSYAELARRLKLNANNESRGRKVAKTELERLRRLIIKFIEIDQVASQEKVKEVNYLAFYDYIEDQKHQNKNHWVVKIDQYIINGFKSGFIASLPIKSLLETRQAESKTILLRVDSLLAHNPRIAMSQALIIDLLCIPEDDYKLSRQVHIKKLLTKITNDLNGRVLTSGCELKVSLQPLGKSFRVCFERGECVVPLTSGQMLLEVNRDSALVDRLKMDMLAAVGEHNPGAVEGLYNVYARSYPEELIRRAISVYHADKPRGEALISPGAFFSSILSRIVKESGYQWVR